MIFYTDHMRIQICPLCNEKFIPAPQHAWTKYDSDVLVCSYHCFRQSEHDYFKKQKIKVR